MLIECFHLSRQFPVGQLLTPYSKVMSKLEFMGSVESLLNIACLSLTLKKHLSGLLVHEFTGLTVGIRDADLAKGVVEDALPLVLDLVLVHDAHLLAGLRLPHLVDQEVYFNEWVIVRFST